MFDEPNIYRIYYCYVNLKTIISYNTHMHMQSQIDNIKEKNISSRYDRSI